MDNSLIPQGSSFGFLATLGGSGVLFTGLLYKAYRLIKGDLRDDKTVQNVDKFVETQNSKIRELEDINKIYSERIERLQKESATAIALSGQLQGQIDGWKLIGEDWKEQRDQKDKELQTLRDEISRLKSQNENLLKMNTFIKPESLEKIKSTTTEITNNG